jgi:hypothetical protein
LGHDILQDDLVDPVELRNTAKRALLFQRYIFRQAFGIIYAIGAVTMAIDLILPYALQTFIGTSSWYWVVYPLAVSFIDIVAAVISIVYMGKATRTIALRNALNPQSSGRTRQRVVIVLWITCYVLAAILLAIFRLEALTILFVLTFTIEALLILQLRRVFFHDIPLESKIAAIVFGASIATSVALSILSISRLGSVPWIVTIVAWLFCALYALKTAPEEWVAGTD